jgi:hypothetical protein
VAKLPVSQSHPSQCRRAARKSQNRILKVQLNCRLKLSGVERGVLGEVGHRLGRMGGLHSNPPGAIGGDRLLHRSGGRFSF